VLVFLLSLFASKYQLAKADERDPFVWREGLLSKFNYLFVETWLTPDGVNNELNC
jgi:hypothetical protein